MALKLGFYGFGAIGKVAAKVALERGHEIVGGVDIKEELIGKDIGKLLGVGNLGVEVGKNVSLLQKADAVIHTTGSYLDAVFDQLTSILKFGLPVVSSCETLAYPYYRYPVLSLRLNEIAMANGAPILGTGINPGFILDTLVATIGSSFPTIKRIKAIRSLDALKRRETFKKKIGLGEKPEIVENMLKEGKITGHVGYAESVLLIAQAGDLNLNRVEEGYQLVVADNSVEIGRERIEKGRNLGIKGYGSGFANDKEVIRIELHAYANAPEFEEIMIEGLDYNVIWKSSGTPGDLGTASILVSTAEKIISMSPGLHIMTELLPFKIKFKPGDK